MISKPNKSKKIAVLGAGSWGGTVAQHLSILGHQVDVWHRNGDELTQMAQQRRHPFLEQLQFSSSLRFVEHISDIQKPDFVVLGVPSHGMRNLMINLPEECKNAIFVNLAKGIENDTLMRMSEIIEKTTNLSLARIVTLSGPSHAEEVAQGFPTSIVAGGVDLSICKAVQQLFSSSYLRVYMNSDIIGVELGGSIKNVIALASGVCDGIGFGDNTKAALITRGIVEISRLGTVLGGKADTFAGLSGMGDLIATCLSHHSRNRYVGEQIGTGRALNTILNEMSMIAEGVKTSLSIKQLSKQNNVEMPICSAVYSVLFEGLEPKEAVDYLMTRELASEDEFIYDNH